MMNTFSKLFVYSTLSMMAFSAVSQTEILPTSQEGGSESANGSTMHLVIRLRSAFPVTTTYPHDSLEGVETRAAEGISHGKCAGCSSDNLEKTSQISVMLEENPEDKDLQAYAANNLTAPLTAPTLTSVDGEKSVYRSSRKPFNSKSNFGAILATTLRYERFAARGSHGYVPFVTMGYKMLDDLTPFRMGQDVITSLMHSIYPLAPFAENVSSTGLEEVSGYKADTLLKQWYIGHQPSSFSVTFEGLTFLTPVTSGSGEEEPIESYLDRNVGITFSLKATLAPISGYEADEQDEGTVGAEVEETPTFIELPMTVRFEKDDAPLSVGHSVRSYAEENEVALLLNERGEKVKTIGRSIRKGKKGSTQFKDAADVLQSFASYKMVASTDGQDEVHIPLLQMRAFYERRAETRKTHLEAQNALKGHVPTDVVEVEATADITA